MAKAMNILILCTGNSARSIIGEVLVSAQDGFTGYSAGSAPKASPHPMALTVLKAHGHDVSTVHSKSWDVFAGSEAPQMDIIITVCDNAANEVCPVWPGHPLQVHWGLPDPAAVEEMNFQRAAFEDIYARLAARLSKLPNLGLEAMDVGARRAALKALAP